jgi:hypothetical protein
VRPPLAALLLALLAGSVATAGCTDCRPQLDVRHCLPGSEGCAPRSDGLVVDWNETHAARWPEVDALIRGTRVGDHSHAVVTRAEERAFWEYWGIDPEASQKEVFARHDGGLYRLRVLSCG